MARLTAENALLQRQNAALTARARLAQPLRALAPSSAASVQVDQQVLVEEEESTLDMASGFLGGQPTPIDEIGTALYLKAKQLIPQGCV